MFSYRATTATRIQPASTALVTPEVLPSGIGQLDRMLPAGGFARGELSEITGGRSCGKRAIASALCAQAIARGHSAVWIDGSGGFYPLLPLEFNIPLQRLIVVRPPASAGGDAPSSSSSSSLSRGGRARVPRFVSARHRGQRCPPALKAADILMQAGGAAALVIVDLPSRTVVPPSQLARLRLGAETSGVAVVFITERDADRSPRRTESLGTFIGLQLCIRRVATSRVEVAIAKSKRGRMAHHTLLTLDEPHSLHLDSTV